MVENARRRASRAVSCRGKENRRTRRGTGPASDPGARQAAQRHGIAVRARRRAGLDPPHRRHPDAGQGAPKQQRATNRTPPQGDRRCRLDHAMELAADHRHVAHHSGHRGRQHGGEQAFALHPIVDLAHGGDHERGAAAGRGQLHHRSRRFGRGNLGASWHRQDRPSPVRSAQERK